MVWLASCIPLTDARVLAVEASIAPRASDPMESLSGKKLAKGAVLNVANGKVNGEVEAEVMIESQKCYVTEYTRSFRDCNKILCSAQN